MCVMICKLKQSVVFSVRKVNFSYRTTDGREAAELDLDILGSEEAMAILSLSLYNLVKEKNNCW